MPTDAPRQKTRKPRNSHTSGARHTSCDSGTMCRRGRVPAACGNKILPIFAPLRFHTARVMCGHGIDAFGASVVPQDTRAKLLRCRDALPGAIKRLAHRSKRRSHLIRSLVETFEQAALAKRVHFEFHDAANALARFRSAASFAPLFPFPQLVEQQEWHDTLAALAVDDDLVGAAEHALHRFQIHPLARHFGRLLVLLVDL